MLGPKTFQGPAHLDFDGLHRNPQQRRDLAMRQVLLAAERENAPAPRGQRRDGALGLDAGQEGRLAGAEGSDDSHDWPTARR